MIVAAPGKLFLTGAWAVLRGAPAVVMAVDRWARATTGVASSRPEVIAVARRLGGAVPAVDVAELELDGRKLGLGGSAAAAVAAAGFLLSDRGLLDPEEVLQVAWAAHREQQPRGSGADVAASALGGLVIARRVEDTLSATRAPGLPAGLYVRAYALPRSARTSDALDRLAEREHEAPVARAFELLIRAADQGVAAVIAGDHRHFLAACAQHVEGLEQLGRGLDLPLVPPEVQKARHVLQSSASDLTVLLPSGAGGGDIVLFLSSRPPNHHEETHLGNLDLQPLPRLGLATHGVHVVPSS